MFLSDPGDQGITKTHSCKKIYLIDQTIVRSRKCSIKRIAVFPAEQLYKPGVYSWQAPVVKGWVIDVPVSVNKEGLNGFCGNMLTH